VSPSSDKFAGDLATLLASISKGLDNGVVKQLASLRDRLVEMNRNRLVKINHSVMELLCAKHLLLKGYQVSLEHPLGDILVCDLYGVKGEGKAIVEVETGYTPPSHALDPSTYNKARLASKIARYSAFCDKFSVGVPPFHLLRIPRPFTQPVRNRNSKDLEEIKRLCDLYYRNPPITLEQIRAARIHTLFMINVDCLRVTEIDPEGYYRVVSQASFG